MIFFKFSGVAKHPKLACCALRAGHSGATSFPAGGFVQPPAGIFLLVWICCISGVRGFLHAPPNFLFQERNFLWLKIAWTTNDA